jgi:hypothetical protein
MKDPLHRRRTRTAQVLAIFMMAALLIAGAAGPALASHSWATYHWARTSNPFTLKVGDNVDSTWDSYLYCLGTSPLDSASAPVSGCAGDWTSSRAATLHPAAAAVLDTTVVAGTTTAKQCKPSVGRVQVCNSSYGNNGWLGIAQVWTSGSHITQGAVKLNDTYFKTSRYNTPAWRSMVMCQEVGHVLGLDHQDEGFNNLNLGSCMDYTNDPAAAPDNMHPNGHDYEQLALIYAHSDASTTVKASAGATGKTTRNRNKVQAMNPGNDPAAWGRVVERDDRGRPLLYDLHGANGQHIFTWVFWAR